MAHLDRGGNAVSTLIYILLLLLPHEAPAPDVDDLTLVATIQAALLVLEYDPGPVDGLLGPSTRRALQHYQADHHIAQTGNLCPVTFESILLDLEVFQAIEALKEVGRRLLEPPPDTVGLAR